MKRSLCFLKPPPFLTRAARWFRAALNIWRVKDYPTSAAPSFFWMQNPIIVRPFLDFSTTESSPVQARRGKSLVAGLIIKDTFLTKIFLFGEGKRLSGGFHVGCLAWHKLWIDFDRLCLPAVKHEIYRKLWPRLHKIEVFFTQSLAMLLAVDVITI